MDLDHFIAQVLDTQNETPGYEGRVEYLEAALEHIARCIYHEEDKLEDFFNVDDV